MLLKCQKSTWRLECTRRCPRCLSLASCRVALPCQWVRFSHIATCTKRGGALVLFLPRGYESLLRLNYNLIYSDANHPLVATCNPFFYVIMFGTKLWLFCSCHLILREYSFLTRYHWFTIYGCSTLLNEQRLRAVFLYMYQVAKYKYTTTIMQRHCWNVAEKI